MSSLRRRPIFARSLLGGFFAASLCIAAHADGLRPAIALPLQKAERALAARQFVMALKQIDKADAVPGKSPTETLTIEQVRAAVDTGRQDDAAAASDYARIIATGGLPPQQVALMAQGEASLDYQTGNYAGAVATIKIYLQGNRTFEPLLLQSYYKQNDCVDLSASVSKLSKPPPETDLQMVASCTSAAKDDAGYLNAMSALVAYYPNPSYWSALLGVEQANPAFTDRLALDFFRLKRAAGVAVTEPETMDMIQVALQAGLANEAAAIIAGETQAGILGTGPDAARQARLKALVATRQAASNANLQAQISAATTAQDDTQLLGIGLNQADAGNSVGLTVMASAIRSGKLSQPGQAELELGIAYQELGQSPNARAMWQSIPPTDTAAPLGKLWLYTR